MSQLDAANSYLDVGPLDRAKRHGGDSGQPRDHERFPQRRSLRRVPEHFTSPSTSDGSATSSARNDDVAETATSSTSTCSDEYAPNVGCGVGERAVLGTCGHVPRRCFGDFVSLGYDSNNRPVEVCLDPTVDDYHEYQCPSKASDRELSTGTPVDFELEVSPSLKEFEADPAHQFWTWNQGKEQWYHQDKETGAILWCPNELD